MLPLSATSYQAGPSDRIQHTVARMQLSLPTLGHATTPAPVGWVTTPVAVELLHRFVSVRRASGRRLANGLSLLLAGAEPAKAKGRQIVIPAARHWFADNAASRLAPGRYVVIRN